MRAIALLIALETAVVVAIAQQADDPASVAAEIGAAVAGDYTCQVEFFGEPRRDSFTDGWIIPYTAEGPDCDGAQAELGRRGEARGIEFLRRPNLVQLRGLLGPIIRTAEVGSGCRIALRGQPVFDSDSTRWFVHVATDGPGCSSAVGDLSADAADIDVVVLQSGPATLRR